MKPYMVLYSVSIGVTWEREKTPLPYFLYLRIIFLVTD
jgi:hypothetical protein